jgi:hypothetical protein
MRNRGSTWNSCTSRGESPASATESDGAYLLAWCEFLLLHASYLTVRWAGRRVR